MKHKHYDMIVAWANGQQIQVEEMDGTWSDIQGPSWSGHNQYRIKPEPKPDVIRSILIEATLFHNEPFVQVFRSRGCVSPNLRLTFDGETGKLKAAEVLQ
jgi:hypothetical protein